MYYRRSFAFPKDVRKTNTISTSAQIKRYEAALSRLEKTTTVTRIDDRYSESKAKTIVSIFETYWLDIEGVGCTYVLKLTKSNGKQIYQFVDPWRSFAQIDSRIDNFIRRCK